MNKQQSEEIDIEEIAETAQRGEDVSSYFTGQHTAKQRVFVDFPLHLLRLIDAECQALDISRQTWIQRVCAEKLHETNQEHYFQANTLVHSR